MYVSTKNRLRSYWLTKLSLIVIFSVCAGVSLVLLREVCCFRNYPKLAESNKRFQEIRDTAKVGQNPSRTEKMLVAASFSPLEKTAIRQLVQLEQVVLNLLQHLQGDFVSRHLNLEQKRLIHIFTEKVETGMDWSLKQAWNGRLQILIALTFFAIAASFYSLLILLLLDSPVDIPLLGHLNGFLPEECVADIGALDQVLRSQQKSIWEIRAHLFMAIAAAAIGSIIVWLNNSDRR